ncbi:MAG: polyphosphate kinase 2 family protein [Chloroflexi bacterium]|nr:polyphosphate kinase 2 family protein [Chloroflexota bacterium]
MPHEDLYERCRVVPGSRVQLARHDPNDSGPYARRRDAASDFKAARARIDELQERLWAEHRRSLLVVFQAMDTGGKDGVIRGVFSGVNPQGCRVSDFKQPSAEELDRDFLWRIHERVPGRGLIGIFNRSHYEDVLVVRVHELAPPSVWRQRYGLINDFERLLSLNGTTILKFFLHISKQEQEERLQKRLDDPSKTWKFSANDAQERRFWDDYMAAYEEALSRCSTDEAPWFIVPANRKWYRDVVVARIVADTLSRLDPRPPKPDPALEKLKIS